MSGYAAPAVVGGFQCVVEGDISFTLGQGWREPHKISVKFPREYFELSENQITAEEEMMCRYKNSFRVDYEGWCLWNSRDAPVQCFDGVEQRMWVVNFWTVSLIIMEDHNNYGRPYTRNKEDLGGGRNLLNMSFIRADIKYWNFLKGGNSFPE